MSEQAGVTAPRGFRAAGVPAGIKAAGGLDLALVVNDGPDYTAAGVFTTNAVRAAPVLWSAQVLKNRELRGVVLNSGGANAATGPGGFQDAHATAEHAAGLLGTGALGIAVCSTGLIGERLPMPAVLGGLDRAHAVLGSDRESALAAASAVLTTDTRPKEAVAGHPSGYRVGGFAKGAGMLAPNLATMLSVITTDAVLDGDTADAALRAATALTFDRLDVDGGTSTNDTVLLLASGASGVRPDTAEFTELLTSVSHDLVLALRADAEGVTKEIDIVVSGAAGESDAVTVARTVAEDNLVKTALFGSDPNWGRIAMAAGRSGVPLDPDELTVGLNGTTLYANGTAVADRSEVDLSGRAVEIRIGLGAGPFGTTVYTTDLSHAYVDENSAYSS